MNIETKSAVMPENYTGWWPETATYWFENGIKQGVPSDPQCIVDPIYHIARGREIYDPLTDAWYWLDANNGGLCAKNKEVWIPYVYQNEPLGSTEGKWVRYDGTGQMVKGLFVTGNKAYVYRQITGAMVKGNEAITFGFNSAGSCISGTVQ